MLKTNRSATVRGKRNNRFLNSRERFNINSRSKTPNSTFYRNKLSGQTRGKEINNYFDKNGFLTNYYANQTNNKYLFTDGTVTKRGTLRTFQPLRSKDEKNNLFKFNEINENFYDPRKSRFPGDEYDYTNREKGFFNRITLYPKWEEFEQKILRGDDLNPYSTNWPSHFLKIGYSSGFYYDDYQDGVPILRLKRIKRKIKLPPIQNPRYSKISETNGEIPPVNFNYMSRQERINYLLSTENNIENSSNAFKSVDARKKLLEKFRLIHTDEYKNTIKAINNKNYH